MISLTDSPIIQTNNGAVKGRTYTFPKTQHLAAAFLGIPYAKPPIGDLRFKKPEPPDGWSQVRNCTNFGGCCPFVEHPGVEFLPRIIHSEDCLYLNVFAPVDKNNAIKTNLPVLFYIHGGGYVIGNSALNGDIGICKYLCSKDVIVVTINYRLGLFGFLATGDSNAVGNYGLWDQVEALKWTKNNIAQFGGDPNRITVFGHSAGGASTDLLCISPHSRDLFQNAAPLAGCSFNNWALTRPQRTLRKALNLAKKRGFQPSNKGSQFDQNAELVSFLRQLPADQLKVAAHGLPIIGNQDAIAMHVAPVFDSDFFPKPLSELRKEAPKRHILTGITSFEGLMFAASGELDKTAKTFIGTYVKDRTNTSKIDEIFNELVPPQSKDHDKECVDIMSDLFISFGVHEMAEFYNKLGGNVYLFTFDYIRKGLTGLLEDFLPFLGANHGTEMAYLFSMLTHSDFKPTEDDEKVIDRFTEYFANFAKYGNPNGSTNQQKWLPISTNNPLRHNVIKLQSDEQKDDFCGGRPLMWHKLLENNRSKL